MKVSFPCPSFPYPVGGVTALYEFANGLARRGHEVHLLHGDYFGGGISSLDDLSWFDFEPALHQHIVAAADLVAATPDLPRSEVVFATGLPAELGLPVLLLQGIDMLHSWIEQVAFSVPALRVCIASWLVDVGEHFGVPRDQFRVVPMGIDHRRFVPRRSDEKRAFDVAVLHNAHPAKGWPVARRALDLVRERHPDLRVVTFGTWDPGPLPDWFDVRTDPGTDALVDDVYGNSRIFVQASDYEGFGFTPVEAMACGAALVTTDNGGSRDYAIHDETALVVAPRDVAAMAAAISALLDDDARRTRIAAAGERYVRRFDWDRAAELLEHHLEEYVADPTRFLIAPGTASAGAALSAGELAAEVLRSTRP